MAKIVNVRTVKSDLTNISKAKINKYKIALLVKDGWKVESKTKVIDVFYKTDSALNATLEGTAKLLFLYTLLFSFGIIA